LWTSLFSASYWGLRSERIQPRPGARSREDLLLPGPADVDRHPVHRLGQVHVQRVLALHHHDALLIAQLPGEGTITGVYRVDASRPALEEAVHEPALVRAEVGDRQSGGIDSEVIERERELLAGASDVRGFAHARILAPPGAGVNGGPTT